MSSDPRKKLFLALNGWTKTGGEGSYYLFESGISATYQPLKQFNLVVLPKYTVIRHRLQYNEATAFLNDPRYITSELDQETFSLTFRLNYTINPDLSIQYYAQPFLTTGRYDNFSYVHAPLKKQQSEQLRYLGPQQLTLDVQSNRFLVDENRDGEVDYSFRQPDFSFAQFRSNLVIRYEYKPGSEIFLVWAQGITDFANPASSLARGFREQLFSKQADNTFLIKATYRFFR